MPKRRGVLPISQAARPSWKVRAPSDAAEKKAERSGTEHASSGYQTPGGGGSGRGQEGKAEGWKNSRSVEDAAHAAGMHCELCTSPAEPSMSIWL